VLQWHASGTVITIHSTTHAIAMCNTSLHTKMQNTCTRAKHEHGMSEKAQQCSCNGPISSSSLVCTMLELDTDEQLQQHTPHAMFTVLRHSECFGHWSTVICTYHGFDNTVGD